MWNNREKTKTDKKNSSIIKINEVKKELKSQKIKIIKVKNIEWISIFDAILKYFKAKTFLNTDAKTIKSNLIAISIIYFVY